MNPRLGLSASELRRRADQIRSYTGFLAWARGRSFDFSAPGQSAALVEAPDYQQEMVWNLVEAKRAGSLAHEARAASASRAKSRGCRVQPATASALQSARNGNVSRTLPVEQEQ